MTDDSSAPVCFCMHITEKELIESIQKGAHTLAAIQKETGATTGCSRCKSSVLAILEKEIP